MKRIYPELESGFEKVATVAKASLNIPTKIIVHHSGGTDSNPLADSSNFTFLECNALHKKYGLKSSLGYWCGYHIYIEKDGKTFRARADTDEGAHTIGQNSQSIGICIAGNFDAKFMTEAQVEAFKGIVVPIMRRWNIPASRIFPHREFALKTCFGKKLNSTWGMNTAKVALATEKKRLEAEVAIINQLNK